MECKTTMTIADRIQEAFEKEKSHRWDQVKVRFSWVNMEGNTAETYLSMRELYRDWHGDCVHCPENDTEVFNLNQLRIQQASKELIYSDTPVTEIASSIGFDTLSHFYHLLNPYTMYLQENIGCNIRSRIKR